MPLERGSRIGRYEILSEIGTGGMSEVYRALDLTLGREVALKILRPAVAARPDSLSRFEREARSVAALSHQNVISLYDFGVDDGVPFLTMELLDGETLRQALAGPMPWTRAARITTAMAEALRAAHARGIIHRDLKPENVFITQDGTVKVLDFGLAQGLAGAVSTTSSTLTAPGTILGTAAYMSPEQVRGEAITPASDLFALGCVLYELLAGVHPFRRDSAAETHAAILRDQPPDLRSRTALQIPEAIIRVVEHALEKRPEARFQTASDFIFALSTAAEGAAAERSGSGARRTPLGRCPLGRCAEREDEIGGGLKPRLGTLLQSVFDDTNHRLGNLQRGLRAQIRWLVSEDRGERLGTRVAPEWIDARQQLVQNTSE